MNKTAVAHCLGEQARLKVRMLLKNPSKVLKRSLN